MADSSVCPTSCLYLHGPEQLCTRFASVDEVSHAAAYSLLLHHLHGWLRGVTALVEHMFCCDMLATQLTVA